jgi:DNA invertase Pin-like site-specific DNA recombinase
MARIGYLVKDGNNDYEADRTWMESHGCVTLIEEEPGDKKRPLFQHLTGQLTGGDELVLAKLSRVVRSPRELATFLNMCRIKAVRLIVIHDKIDTRGDLFPTTTPADILNIVALLPSEILAYRHAGKHLRRLRTGYRKPVISAKAQSKEARRKMVIDLYKKGVEIDRIWQKSGFKSRSSIFRIVKEAGEGGQRRRGRSKKETPDA